MPQAFPTDAQIEHLATLLKWQRLYDGEHYAQFGIKPYFVDDQKKEEKLYIATNLCALISEYFADMIVGEGVGFSVDDDTTNEKLTEIVENNDLEEVLLQLALDQSNYGFGVLRVRRSTEDEKMPIVEQIPVDQYFPTFGNGNNQPPTKVVLASYIEDPLNPNNKNGLIYKEIYEKAEGGVIISYELWSVNAQKKADKRLTFSDYAKQMGHDGASVTLEKAKRIPIWQIDNLKRTKDAFGKSDYKDIEGQVEEINDRVTHISVQLIKNGNARLAVPKDSLGDQDVNVKDIELFEVAPEDKMPQYITNSNPQIENAFTFIDKLIMIALGIAKVPPEMLRVESSAGNEKVEAMRLRMFPSLRKISRKRVNFKRSLQGALAYALEIAGAKEAKTVRIQWDDVLPIDYDLLTTRMVQRKAAGLVSTVTAIEQMDNVSREEAEAEAERIKAEEPPVPDFNPLSA